MSDPTRSRSERGQGTLEYVMLLGIIAAAALLLLKLLYSGPAVRALTGTQSANVETLVVSWGEFLAQQIAGDRIDANGDAWGVD